MYRKIKFPMNKNQLKEVILRQTEKDNNTNLNYFKKEAREIYLLLLDYYFLNEDKISDNRKLVEFFKLGNYENFLMIIAKLKEEQLKNTMSEKLDSIFTYWREDYKKMEQGLNEFEYTGKYFEFSMQQFCSILVRAKQ